MSRGLLVGALIGAVACAEIVEDPNDWAYDGPVNSCKGDADCSTGSCDDQLGRCVLPAPGGEPVFYLRVIPDPVSAVPSQVFTVELGSDGWVGEPLRIQQPVAVVGYTLARHADDTFAALDARVIFTDVGNRLPGRPARITVYEAAGGSVFDLDLLPSVYDLMAIPGGDQAEDFPVYYLDGVTLDGAGKLTDSVGAPVDLVVPEAEQSVAGIVRQGGLQMNGLTVKAIDPESERVVSTTAVTDCVPGDGEEQCGWFRIKLAPGTETFTISITRPSEPHHPAVLATGFSIAPEVAELDLTDDDRLSLAPLGVPVRYQARVERPVESATGDVLSDPAPGCFVLFESGAVAGGQVRRWVTTNESGALEEAEGVLGVSLYPGEYTVTVIPAEALSGSLSDYQAFVSAEPITISGSSDIGGQVFTLGWRPLIKGDVVVGADPVPQATLTAEPHVAAPPHARSSTGNTGRDGDFAMWLDPAPYYLNAEAPSESGYAWGAKLLDVTGNAELDVALPIPFVARATLAGASQQIEVAGAVVEWYRVTDGRAYAVGRVQADTAGEVTALLPP